MKVEENCKVKLNYGIKLSDGQLVESNPEDKPLEFITGREEVIPSLEQGIMGMEEGEKKSFEVEPSDAFGHRDPEAVRVVNREDLVDKGADLEEGMIFRVRDEEGGSFLITVISMDEDEVVFDLNHPLAGARLMFDVEVLEINQPAPA